MTSPKPLLPAPPKRVVLMFDGGYRTGHSHAVFNPKYADWLLDVATRAMEYAHHENDCWKKANFQAQDCTCGLNELRAAIDKARGGGG